MEIRHNLNVGSAESLKNKTKNKWNWQTKTYQVLTDTGLLQPVKEELVRVFYKWIFSDLVGGLEKTWCL